MDIETGMSYVKDGSAIIMHVLDVDYECSEYFQAKIMMCSLDGHVFSKAKSHKIYRKKLWNWYQVGRELLEPAEVERLTWEDFM